MAVVALCYHILCFLCMRRRSLSSLNSVLKSLQHVLTPASPLGNSVYILQRKGKQLRARTRRKNRTDYYGRVYMHQRQVTRIGAEREGNMQQQRGTQVWWRAQPNYRG